MLISDELLQSNDNAAPSISKTLGVELSELLQRAFGVEFAVLDGQSGDVLHAASGQPARDWAMRAELCREAARRGRPELIDDEDPFFTLALPLSDAAGNAMVAAATFVARRVELREDLSRPAELLGMRPEETYAWARVQTPWSPDTAIRVAELVLKQAAAERRVGELQSEAEKLSVNLVSTYEEISLLYRLTQNLKLSRSNEDLGRMALESMQEVLPAVGLAIQLAGSKSADKSPNHADRAEPLLLTYGDCPIDGGQFSNLIAYLGPNPSHRPMVVNRPLSGQPDWPCPQVRQIVAVALAEGENVFGWLAALNRVDDGEFGTVEASLMSSVAAILGIHSGNIQLYRQQSDLLAGIVRALTSAIDAKDPYTCGHSDRVARVAIRLAEELGCDKKITNTLYLAGMLHDIGKIGIDDSVLRKAGKLTTEEYDHIKRHVEIGHRILQDIAKLEDVLPVVLHHHESWDGNGYPRKLGLKEIPLAARIVAVADSFDAMSSDRPYRKGMPNEKIEQILRAGAGQQWDPEVVGAFFRARDDIRRISHQQQQPAGVDLPSPL
jgi:putative nucleotidyltransferase with HDIG domain